MYNSDPTFYFLAVIWKAEDKLTFLNYQKRLLPVISTGSNTNGLLPCFTDFVIVFSGSWEICDKP